MANKREVRVAVVGDASQLKREMDVAERKVAGFGDSTRKAGNTMRDVFIGGAVVIGMKKIADGAAELEQAIGGTSAVFEDASGAIDEFVKTSAESAGLSERTARTLTSRLGASLKGVGLDAEEAAKQSVFLTQVGADLAATLGGSSEEAVSALGAAFRGEFDPLERFGIALKASDINAKAMSMGLAKSQTDVSNYAKGQAALALITEKSAFAQGQFAKEADTASGAAAIGAAKMQNASDDLGKSFLPIYSKIAETTGAVAGAFSALPSGVQTALVALTAVALVGPKLVSAFGDAKNAVQAFTRSQAAATSAIGAGAIAVGGAIAAWQIWEAAVGRTDDAIKEIGDRSRSAIDTETYAELADRMARINAQIDKLRNSKSIWIWDADKNAQIDNMVSELDSVNVELGNQAALIGTLTWATGTNEAAVIQWLSAQREAGIVYSDSEVALAAYTGSIDTNKLSADDAAEAQRGYATAVAEAAKEVKAATDPYFAALNAQDKVTKAQEEYNNAAAMFGADSTVAQEYYRKLVEAGLDAAGAMLDLTAKQNDGTASAEQLQAQLNLLTMFGIDPTSEAATDLAGQFYLATLAGNELGQLVIAPQVSAPGLDEVIGKFILLEGKIKQVTGLGVTAGISPYLAANSAEPRAMGGPVSRNGTYLVGEQGPELFTPSQSGYITPNGGDSNTFNIYGSTDARATALEIIRQRRAQSYLAGAR